MVARGNDWDWNIGVWIWIWLLHGFTFNFDDLRRQLLNDDLRFSWRGLFINRLLR